MSVTATRPAPKRMLQCTTCGEAAGFGYMVFDLAESAGPLYQCKRCRQGSTERRCEQCGIFMRRVADYTCPEQDWDPDLIHETTVATLYQCPVCDERGNEIQYFDADQIDDHLLEHDEEDDE